MRRRVAIARNLAKAWLILLVPAGLMAFAGWKLGGYRLSLLFGGSVVLLGAALYWYADRIVMGMVGARELLPGEAPALHSAVDRLRGRRCGSGRGCTCCRTGIRARCPAGAGRRAARRWQCPPGCSASRRRPSSKASSRTSCAHLRNRDVLVQTLVVIVSGAVVEMSRIGGFLEARSSSCSGRSRASS